ncbi:metalloregulator ArsR/SmtB family transcription factor [Antarcticibacterium sp. 1MA-6-2]|uniref:ArsR/SmtB family transcription factor n=1 Tax=Antarcticibacterium sp. 1MA-6-2 TaxID=2908210 RepID=UPI001F299873|nr:metalloregulator ArsR/SmtB family transcription factor [Antarcticibacterium sp. 1MA-6-2]UJH91390.1 metalloregulator ArsR/SmtB family transcription factor [Antarcticibacterium sp. 1MA-6-2]
MGITKSEIFSPLQNEIANLARVLGHPARIAILQQIMKSESCICGDLAMEIGLAQPTISQHLKELKSVGLIKGTIEGVKVCYCIDQENWKQMNGLLTEFFNQNLNNNNDCC